MESVEEIVQALAAQLGQSPFLNIFGDQRVRDALRITDEAIAQAVRYLFHDMGLRIEPSGAVTVAALLTGAVRPDGPVAAILSGGNVDPDLFAKLTA